MAPAGYGDLLSRIREAEVVSLCHDLVRFKSVNPPGNELEIAEYVAGVLREAGLTVEVIPHTPTRASVLARLEGSGDVPALLYTGHLDVVPVGAEEWLHDPFGGEVVGGKLWGRGSSDMKGGDAAMIAAARVLAAADLPLIRASVEVINDRMPVATSPEELVVQRFYDVVAEVVGERPVSQADASPPRGGL